MVLVADPLVEAVLVALVEVDPRADRLSARTARNAGHLPLAAAGPEGFPGASLAEEAVLEIEEEERCERPVDGDYEEPHLHTGKPRAVSGIGREFRHR